MEENNIHLKVILGFVFGILALFIIIRLFAVPISNNYEEEVDTDADTEETLDDTTEEDDSDDSIPIVDNNVTAYVMGEPSITLNGDEVVFVQIGSEYLELGAVASDSKYGDISSNIVITGDVNTDVLGTYFITYAVTNKDGVSITVRRQVNVTDLIGPEIGMTGEVLDTVISIEADSSLIYDDTVYLTLQDNLGGNVSVVRSFYYTSDLSIPYEFVEMNEFTLTRVGYYKVYYVAVDEFGNRTPLSMPIMYHVTDSINPSLVSTKGVEFDIAVGSTVNESEYYSASDNLGIKAVASKYELYNDVTGTYNEIDELSLPSHVIGKYRVTYTAMDLSGLFSNELVIIYNVKDMSSPTYTTPNGTDISFSMNNTGYDESNDYTLSDNIDMVSDLSVVRSYYVFDDTTSTYVLDNAISSLPFNVSGKYRVDYKVMDRANNRVEFSIYYTVKDVLPVVTISSRTDAVDVNKYYFDIAVDDDKDIITNFEYVFLDHVPVDLSFVSGWNAGTVGSTVPEIIAGDTRYLIIKVVDSDGHIVMISSDPITATP